MTIFFQKAGGNYMKNSRPIMQKSMLSLFAIIICLSAGCIGKTDNNRNILITQTIAFTVDPKQTESPSIEAKTPALAINVEEGANEGRKVYFIDKDLFILSEIPNVYMYLSLSSRDCELLGLIVNTDSGQIKLYNIDFLGNLPDQKDIYFFPGENHNKFNFLISPTEDWIAFLQVSNDYGIDFSTSTNQQVYIIGTKETNTHIPIAISVNGGTSPNSLIWSPNGQLLTYVDFDQSKVRQVFTYSPMTGERKQITQFIQDQKIEVIKWSPDQQAIALETKTQILVGSNNTYRVNFGIISLPSNNYEIVQTFEPDVYNISFWWGENNQVMILSESNTYGSDTIDWYDNDLRQFTHKYSPSVNGVPSSIALAFPLSSDLDWVLLPNGPYIYKATEDYLFAIKNDPTAIPFDNFLNVIQTTSGSLKPNKCK
jgi:hypothetical protein